MASVKLILNHHKTNANGEVPLYIRIIQHRKPKYISLGILLIPKKHWDFENQQVKRPFPNPGRVNNYIAQRMAEAQDIVMKLEDESKTVSSKNIKQAIMGRPPESFITYADKQIERLNLAGQIWTAIRYQSVINKLSRYLKGKDFTFDDFTVSFLYDFEAHLRSLGNKTNTIHSNLKTFTCYSLPSDSRGYVSSRKKSFLQIQIKKGTI